MNIFKITYKPKEPLWWEPVRYGSFFKKLSLKQPAIKNFTVLDFRKYNAHLLFYVKAFNHNGYQIKYVKNPEYLIGENETIVTCMDEQRERLKREYNYEIFYEDERCMPCAIKAKNLN